jgi:hypothetical protein
MFAMFAQTATGLTWLANYNSVEEARAEIDRNEYEAVFVVPLSEFRQFD